MMRTCLLIIFLTISSGRVFSQDIREDLSVAFYGSFNLMQVEVEQSSPSPSSGFFDKSKDSKGQEGFSYGLGASYKFNSSYSGEALIIKDNGFNDDESYENFSFLSLILSGMIHFTNFPISLQAGARLSLLPNEQGYEDLHYGFLLGPTYEWELNKHLSIKFSALADYGPWQYYVLNQEVDGQFFRTDAWVHSLRTGVQLNYRPF